MTKHSILVEKLIHQFGPIKHAIPVDAEEAEIFNKLSPEGSLHIKPSVLGPYIERLLSQSRQEVIEEVLEWCLDERDKVADSPEKFNRLDDEYKEGYWIAMNSIAKHIEAIQSIKKIK